MKSNHSKPGPWRIGDLAKAVGTSTDTLRHYERKGVLVSQRLNNGYRVYPEDALERVRTIRKALAIGFTLDELSLIFKVFNQGGAPCHQVRTLAASKLTEIEKHLEDVIALRDDLKTALSEWDLRLAKTASGQRAGLLTALAARSSVQSSSNSLLIRKPNRTKKGKRND
jgi:DNA-binding transcriptional MerR regulator